MPTDMNKDEIYAVWRPETSPWSRWVKPVLFSFLGERELKAGTIPVPPWAVPLTRHAAVIVDLPGTAGLSVGMALARSGFRPVPVYNACPFEVSNSDELQAEPAWSVVDLLPTMRALSASAKTLATLTLEDSSPPAFLLDTNRRGTLTSPPPGWFDNRSFLSETDLPSAAFLGTQGIDRVILIQSEDSIQPDLRPILLTLQQDGIAIERQAPWAEWKPMPTWVKRPMFLARAWYLLKQRFGYRRNQEGEFGEAVRARSAAG